MWYKYWDEVIITEWFYENKKWIITEESISNRYIISIEWVYWNIINIELSENNFKKI